MSFFVDPNRPPVAKAGGDRVVTLPSTLVIINGSASSDDKGIVSYLWTRDKSSPAAGVGVHYRQYMHCHFVCDPRFRAILSVLQLHRLFPALQHLIS